MALGNWNVTVSVSDVDETMLAGKSPADYVLRLATAKAQAAVGKAGPGQFIVAADTTVVDHETILGKPMDAADAVQMLRQLRGHKHKVYTGLTLVKMAQPGFGSASLAADPKGNPYNGNRIINDVCVTDVPMRDYSDDEIHSYVETGDPLDKAGSYGIQNSRFVSVVPPRGAGEPATDGLEGMSGCYASVMGLPLCHLMRLFRQMGAEPDGGLPGKCQAHLNYQCPVTSAILQGWQVG